MWQVLADESLYHLLKPYEYKTFDEIWKISSWKYLEIVGNFDVHHPGKTQRYVKTARASS